MRHWSPVKFICSTCGSEYSDDLTAQVPMKKVECGKPDNRCDAADSELPTKDSSDSEAARYARHNCDGCAAASLARASAALGIPIMDTDRDRRAALENYRKERLRRARAWALQGTGTGDSTSRPQVYAIGSDGFTDPE